MAPLVVCRGVQQPVAVELKVPGNAGLPAAIMPRGGGEVVIDSEACILVAAPAMIEIQAPLLALADGDVDAHAETQVVEIAAVSARLSGLAAGPLVLGETAQAQGPAVLWEAQLRPQPGAAVIVVGVLVEAVVVGVAVPAELAALSQRVAVFGAQPPAAQQPTEVGVLPGA